MKRRLKRTLSVLSAAAMLICMIPTGSLAHAATDDCVIPDRGDHYRICSIENLNAALSYGITKEIAGKISAAYQEAVWNGSAVTYTSKTAESCTQVESSAEAVAWNTGWYVVNSSATIDQPITVNGDVNLILADGCTLNAMKGIVVPENTSLAIYAQENGSGTLNATGTVDDSSHNASAGIGGSTTSFNSGKITIHGGIISATGGESTSYGGAGIGGGTRKVGNGGSGSEITIYGGKITANSGAGSVTGAGIGGGGSGDDNGGSGSKITIYGGSVTAVSMGSTGGAGIGGGGGASNGGDGGGISIYGGIVHAIGGNGGAGIGGGSGSSALNVVHKSGSGNITISGGKVTAVGGQCAAGIGGGGGFITYIEWGGTKYSSDLTGGSGIVKISGGIVDAKSGESSIEGYEGDSIGNGGNDGNTSTGDVTRTAGMIFENTVGKVYGSVTLDETYIVPAGYSLTFEAGAQFNGNYAFYQNDIPIRLDVVRTQGVSGPATVQECQHDGITPTCNNNGTHSLECPYCDFRGQEQCDYSTGDKYNETAHTQICTACGGSRSEAHTIKYTAAVDNNNVITVREACAICGYEKNLGTVTLHIPELAYGDLTKEISAVTTLEEFESVYVGVNNYGSQSILIPGGSISIAMGQLTQNTLLDAAQHKLQVGTIINSNPQKIAECELEFTVDSAPLTEEMVELSEADFTYSGVEQKPGVIVRRGETQLNEGVDYEISYSRNNITTSDLTSAGTVTVTVAGKGNYKGKVERTYTIAPAASTIVWSDSHISQERIYTGNPADIEPPSVTLVKGGSFSGNIHYSHIKEGETTCKDGLPTDAGTYTVMAQIDAEGNYAAAVSQNKLSLTIQKANAEIQVGVDTYKKKFGDEAFTLDVTANNPEAAVQYAVTQGTNVVSVSNGTVAIQNAGTATITVSLPSTANYNAAPNKVITVEVAKAAVPSMKKVLKQYINTKGSSGDTAALDVAGKLPADRGTTNYNIISSDGSNILSDVAVDQNGKLTYKVGVGEVGSTASIQVTAEMANYESAEFTLEIKLVDVIQVEITAEAEKAVYDGSQHKGYADGITCDYPVAGYIFAYQGYGDTIYNSNEPPVDAGSYTVTISVSDQSGDYEGAVPLDFTIEKASITIKADDKTAEKGDPIPELTYTISGMAQKDRLAAAPEMTCGADMKTEGSYPILVSGAKVPDRKNYYEEITYKNGTLTVLKKDLGSSTGSFGGSTGGSPGSIGSGTNPASKQPFIKDSSGRKGWDVIRAAAETAAAAQAGGTVVVDMNGTVSVPGSVFAAVRGKDVTLCFDMGSGITWSVNGKDITAETAGDTDFSVKADAGVIPKELIAETAAGLAHLELSLAHEGAFGFTATLTLRIVSRDGNGITVGSSGTAAGYTGMYANLFYYNPNLRSLEFICAGQIGEDGTADLPFVHASDYTVILSAYPMGGTDTPGNPQEPEETEKPQKPAEQAGVKSVKLSKTLYTYNGKSKKPSVIAVDTEGRKISAKYYTVSYQNNKKVGKATVTVKFKGGYSGTVKKTFKIRPAGTSIQKLAAASGGFTVKWKKKTVQTSGYQIQYSANDRFKGSSTCSVFVKKNSTVKKTVKNLKAGKKYYVRIRTYKTVKVDGKNTKIYSTWSRTCKA